MTRKKGQIKSVTIRDSSTNEEYQVEGDILPPLPVEVMAKLTGISKLIGMTQPWTTLSV